MGDIEHSRFHHLCGFNAFTQDRMYAPAGFWPDLVRRLTNIATQRAALIIYISIPPARPVVAGKSHITSTRHEDEFLFVRCCFSLTGSSAPFAISNCYLTSVSA